METAKELIQKLNISDEINTIEAKKGSEIDRSIIETICAFANEPEMGGGHLLLGVEREDTSLFPQYIVTGITDPDKLQLDISTQCASMFNQPVRPEITVEQVNGRNVLNIFVAELPPAQKPVYFRNEGLPRGAYRRIGSGDQRCTDDDLFVFYNKEDSFDSSVIKDSGMDDISEDAITQYRQLRKNVNPYAEELQYNDLEMLQALGCVKKEGSNYHLTYAGLLVFGKKLSHRRLLPMVRVDYIRVPGNEWIEDPEHRFATIDMRGSLLEMVQRVFSQITDDLPKGFLLPEGALQAESTGLPGRVLREAIVNALIHRTYRESQPIQIIRYGNRLEIKNPGFSLKPEEHLGEPGSKNRNPFVAAIFHETNLAETKGSGIRTMRSLMQKSQLMPPTFESDHGRNQFTTRLLLHHFLGAEDVQWLSGFSGYELNEDQKRALIFTKEVGAVDNSAYRQLNSVDTLRASTDLRDLRAKEILEQKGKGRYTYYIPGEGLISTLSAPPPYTKAPVQATKALPQGTKAPPQGTSAPTQETDSQLHSRVPDILQARIKTLGKRIDDESVIKEIILVICATEFFKSTEIAFLMNKNEGYLKRKFLSPMVATEELIYLFPEMINHPEQAYKTNTETA